MNARDRRWVAARRATVAALHPDRGGDPETFIAALAALDSAHGPCGGTLQAPLIVIRRHRRWRRFLARISRAVHHLPGMTHHYAHL